jgi:hypothetical protein
MSPPPGLVDGSVVRDKKQRWFGVAGVGERALRRA